MAIVSMRKQYPGHAKRVMFGVWSFLRQFMYTKFIVVTDDDVNVRDWKEVIWAITTRVDPVRDTLLVDNTPIDYLDFASPVAGLGGKMGIDATNKWPGETQREWPAIAMDSAVKHESMRCGANWGSSDGTKPIGRGGLNPRVTTATTACWRSSSTMDRSFTHRRGEEIARRSSLALTGECLQGHDSGRVHRQGVK